MHAESRTKNQGRSQEQWGYMLHNQEQCLPRAET